MSNKTPPAEKQRIVLVEDHLLIREHIARVINKEADMEVSGEADNIKDALETVQNVKPHLVMVDISLNAENGLDLIKTLKMLSIPVPILVLSMHDESIHAERAFRAGAQGYITKHQPSHEVVAAIRKVLAGKLYLSEKMVDTVLRKLVPGGLKDAKYAGIDRLSSRELTILELIGHGSSSRAISGELVIGMASVATYRRRIRKKLGIANSNELQHFAIEWLSERA